MYIDRVKIRNVRAISSLDLRLPPNGGRKGGLTVILGPNGVGKTTLLQAIAATIVGPLNALSILERLDDFVHVDAETAATDVWIRASAEDWRAPKDVKGVVRLGVTWSRHSGPVARPPRGEHNFVYSQLWDGAAFGARPKGWFFAGYGTIRAGGHPSHHAGLLLSAPPRRASVVSLLRSDAPLLPIHTWLHSPSSGGGETIDDYLMRVHLLAALLSDGLLFPDESRKVMFDLTPQETIMRAGSVRVPLESVGAGAESLVTLVADIVRQMASFYGAAFMGGPKWRPVPGRLVSVPHSGVVLIDELDQSLDSLHRSHVGGWLRDHFPAVQFIVTTHSEELSAAADPGRLLTMGRRGVMGVAGELDRDQRELSMAHKARTHRRRGVR